MNFNLKLVLFPFNLFFGPDRITSAYKFHVLEQVALALIYAKLFPSCGKQFLASDIRLIITEIYILQICTSILIN